MTSPSRRGLAPALTLFVLTPLIAEYLLGSLSLAQLGALPVLCLLYGSGTVLIRETARARRNAWATIAGLGLAYGLLEEGLATQSLFNPHYLHLRLLDYGFIRSLGMGASWTVYVLGLHVVWSICVPIGLVEGLYPALDETPWLGRAGHVVFAVLFALGVAATAAYSHRTEHFLASVTQLGLSAVGVVAIVVLTLKGWRRASERTGDAAAPSVWLVAAVALIAGSLFELVQTFQGRGIHWMVTVGARLAIAVSSVWLIHRWSMRRGWMATHRFALAAGGMLVYCWWGFGVEQSLHGVSGLRAHGVLVGAAVALLVVAAVRLQGATRSRAGAVVSRHERVAGPSAPAGRARA